MTKPESSFPGFIGNLLASAPLGAVVIDLNGLLIWANALAMTFLGDSIEIGGIMLASKDWPHFRDLVLAQKPFYYLLGEQGFMFSPMTSELSQDQDWLLLWMIPSAAMTIDFVEMQTDLIRHRKLANLGQMMTEMAHEMNNPLASISMDCQLAGMSLKKLKKQIPDEHSASEPLRETVDKVDKEIHKIIQSTAKAAHLCQEILAYSKPNQMILRPYQVNRMVKQILNQLKQQSIFHQMTLCLEPLKTSSMILCDPLKIEQILYNLLKNAHEATQGKGTVWIREQVEPPFVLLEVEDNGPGIPAEILDKIFSPFLTTKPRTGNGLGLSISQQIIREHGGSFSVYNKPDSGACFQIRLPQAAPLKDSL